MEPIQPILVAPSVLSADFSCIAEGVKQIEQSAADWVHLDVMDGSFVPQITFGSKMAADIRAITRLPLDAHLMVVHPEMHVDAFCLAGVDRITVHAEASIHLHRLIWRIKEKGCKAGVSIVPSTPLSAIEELYGVLDLILIMTVNPGYGGQTIIPACLEKVSRLRRIKEERGLDFLIQVDGGINAETCTKAVASGSEVLVIGSAFFSSDDPQGFVKRMKSCRQAKSL
jgi:ribulose-phosphate 3-epimerase